MRQAVAEYDLACVLLAPDATIAAHYARDNGLAVHPVDAHASSSVFRVVRAVQRLFCGLKTRLVHIDCGRGRCVAGRLPAPGFSTDACLVLGKQARIGGLTERLPHVAPQTETAVGEAARKGSRALYDALAVKRGRA